MHRKEFSVVHSSDLTAKEFAQDPSGRTAAANPGYYVIFEGLKGPYTTRDFAYGLAGEWSRGAA